ncbi:hypothetical protein PPERSA_00843 [Pseudocohnilembus persalinus]|uniref:Uncharacterized protein n=1 Tax=Pseudocohnilembus persalinus TaxID=266149 RepID=A0A0V0R7C4_PSEPJ|nr:hypothetical protein PPERSA_00843 [Pseudocohnilembus persalinus]|eukprot:KRX10363.1 hypothetical protein PPERSA_00843 [Pseudocohnilembus persalinus]
MKIKTKKKRIYLMKFYKKNFATQKENIQDKTEENQTTNLNNNNNSEEKDSDNFKIPEDAEILKISPTQKNWRVDILSVFPNLNEGIEMDEIENWINELRSYEKAMQLGCVWVVKCGKSYGRYPRKLELICTKNGCTAYFNMRVQESKGNKYYLEEEQATHDQHIKFTEKEIFNRVNRIKSLKGTRVRKPKDKKNNSIKSGNLQDDQDINDDNEENTQDDPNQKSSTLLQEQQNLVSQNIQQNSQQIQQYQMTRNQKEINYDESKYDLLFKDPDVENKKVYKKRGRKPANYHLQQQEEIAQQQQLQNQDIQQPKEAIQLENEHVGGGEAGYKLIRIAVRIQKSRK